LSVVTHSFDLAREGYVNLLSGRRRRPAQGPHDPGTGPIEGMNCTSWYLI